jgi:hypothetical protein
MPELDEFTLTSSNLSAGIYDFEKQELRITFTSGATYLYRGVPQETVDGLKTDPSPGKYFYRHIRDSFPFQRV